VGVQRQYSGTLGQIDNCQIATFIAYVTPERDRVLLDRRPYLPKNRGWRTQPAAPRPVCHRSRCSQTRPQQVREMIEAAVPASVPFAWFTADEEFGQNPGPGDYLETSRIP
jgi:SRSO17 transposase